MIPQVSFVRHPLTAQTSMTPQASITAKSADFISPPDHHRSLVSPPSPVLSPSAYSKCPPPSSASPLAPSVPPPSSELPNCPDPVCLPRPPDALLGPATSAPHCSVPRARTMTRRLRSSPLGTSPTLAAQLDYLAHDPDNHRYEKEFDSVQDVFELQVLPRQRQLIYPVLC